jgi:hypothetical protein
VRMPSILRVDTRDCKVHALRDVASYNAILAMGLHMVLLYCMLSLTAHLTLITATCRPASKTLHIYAMVRQLAPGAATQPADDLELRQQLGLALLTPLPELPGFVSQLSSGTDVQVKLNDVGLPDHLHVLGCLLVVRRFRDGNSAWGQWGLSIPEVGCASSRWK